MKNFVDNVIGHYTLIKKKIVQIESLLTIPVSDFNANKVHCHPAVKNIFLSFYETKYAHH